MRRAKRRPYGWQQPGWQGRAGQGRAGQGRAGVQLGTIVSGCCRGAPAARCKVTPLRISLAPLTAFAHVHKFLACAVLQLRPGRIPGFSLLRRPAARRRRHQRLDHGRYLLRHGRCPGRSVVPVAACCEGITAVFRVCLCEPLVWDQMKRQTAANHGSCTACLEC